MPAYLIADVDVKDPETYRTYSAQVPATIEQFGGQFLVRGGARKVAEGGWGPRLDSNGQALEYMVRAIEAAGFEPGRQVSIAVDAAASHFHRAGRYALASEGRVLDAGEIVRLYERWAGKYPLVSVEDPLAEEDIYSYVKLNEKLDIPIMATEFAPGRYYGMTQWITQYATDILRGDVAVTGGITPLVRLCHLAEGFQMKCEIHHGGNSLNNVANLHVTMAVPNCEFFEYFPSTGGFIYGLVEDIDMSGGTVSAPTNPGLGYEIDWDLINNQRIATLE